MDLILVRSMHRASIMIAISMLAGCAADPPVPQLQVFGPYAKRLSRSDIQQITACVGATPDVQQTYTKLEAVSPTEVRVAYVGYELRWGMRTGEQRGRYFTAYKRNRKWVCPTELVQMN